MKSFNEIYEKVYKESNTTLEQARNKATNGMLLIIFIILMVGTISSVITKSFLLIFMALLIIALYIAFSRNRRNYTKLFKEKVISTFVKEYSSRLEYLPSKGIDKLSYIKGEFERPDRFFSEDLITGTLEDGNRISMSEVISEIESRDSDGNVEYLTMFYGLFAEIKLNNTVLANIKIRKNTLTLIKPKDKIEMDSSEFEKVFNERFGEEFILYTKEEFLGKHMLGFGNKHKKVDDFIGNYISLSIRGASFKLGTYISKEKIPDVWKSAHCGLSSEEMEVPLIVI